MATIAQDDLIESVADALQFISYYHPADYIEHLARAYQFGPNALRNAATARAAFQVLVDHGHATALRRGTDRPF